MTFDELFDIEKWQVNFKPEVFSWFDLEHRDSTYPCATCGKPTSWYYWESEEYPASPCCGPDCIAVLTEEPVNELQQVPTRDDATPGAIGQETVHDSPIEQQILDGGNTGQELVQESIAV